MEDIDLLGVTSGPGSFTGLRIGLSVVKGLALPRQIPCAGVSTMAALAYGLASEGTVIGAQDARRGQVYWGAFDLATHTRLTEDAAAPVTSLEKFVQDCKKPLFFVGDGATLCYNSYKQVCGVCSLSARPAGAAGCRGGAGRQSHVGSRGLRCRLLPCCRTTTG